MWDTWHLSSCLGLGTRRCAHVALGLLPKAHTWCLCHASSLRTRGAWAPCLGLGTPQRKRGIWAALKSCLTGGHTPAHKWCLGPASVLRPRGTWAAYLVAWHTPAHVWCLGMQRPNYP